MVSETSVEVAKVTKEIVIALINNKVSLGEGTSYPEKVAKVFEKIFDSVKGKM